MFALNKLVRFMCNAHPERKLVCHKHRRYVHGAFISLLVHCSSIKEAKINPIQYPDPRHLSHEHLIQQACTATVNSTCQLLTCTLVALVDVGQKYRKSLHDQLSLLEESLTHIGNDILQDELTDILTEARSNTATLKKSFMELISLMDYVEKLVNSATETSFLAGAETASTALSERLHSAQLMIKEQTQEIKKLEEELVNLQKTIIIKSQKTDSS